MGERNQERVVLFWIGLGSLVGGLSLIAAGVLAAVRGDGDQGSLHGAAGVLLLFSLISVIAARHSPTWRWLLSPRLAIWTAVAVSLPSVAGWLVIQGAPAEVYLERFGEVLGRVILFIGLDHVFSTPWFTLLLLFLCYDILVCSTARLGRTLRIARVTEFRSRDEDLESLQSSFRLPLSRNTDDAVDVLRRALSRRWYWVRERRSDTDVLIAASKGGHSRVGLYLTHVSLVLIVLGGLVSGIRGYRAMVFLAPGETGRVKEELFQLRVDDFRIETVESDGMVRIEDYVTDLTVLENGREVLQRTIQVNEPLRYKGLNVYQSSWRYSETAVDTAYFSVEVLDTADRVPVEIPRGEITRVPGTEISLQVLRFVPDFAMDLASRQVFSRSQELRNPGVYIRVIHPRADHYEQWVLPAAPESHNRSRDGQYLFLLTDLAVTPETGLECARQPGMPLVWTGFALISLGVCVYLYVSHRRIWARVRQLQTEGDRGQVEILLGADTNRNRTGLEREVASIRDQLVSPHSRADADPGS